MRGLKITAAICLSLLIACLCVVGYLFQTAKVSVVQIRSEGVSAAIEPVIFESLKQAVEDETFYGTLYQKPLSWKDASDYVYLTYTVRLRNDCLVPIDMVEIQVVPQSSDILQLPDLNVHSLELKSEGELSARILSPKDTHPVREIIVTYYVWGVSFSLKTIYGM